jgi:phage terminase small subunit
VLEEFDGVGKDRKWIGYTKKVKFWSKEKCLELMGKHKKMFTDVLEVKGDLYEKVAKARARIGKT